MSSRWRFALLPILLLTQLPLVIRNWAFIVEGWPTWRLMLAQTLAVIAAAILLAGAVALLVVWRRARRDANA